MQKNLAKLSNLAQKVLQRGRVPVLYLVDLPSIPTQNNGRKTPIVTPCILPSHTGFKNIFNRLCKLKSNCHKIHEKCVSKLPVLACALWNSTTYSPYTKLYTLPQPSEVGTEKKVKLVFSKLILLLLRKHTMAGISKYCRKITSPFLASNVVCMSSGDLLI